ncbi:hypothetical protein P7K49_023049 [Saguinus oedipus]|uniref:Uncharacterized protein n=1 Tax=Saguinus oedipus TaxID=9490 RepID=A0ABQ9UM27_SAGOE|nr:hypothetical protein P7K49_023049 [Saguinus oedipus]
MAITDIVLTMQKPYSAIMNKKPLSVPQVGLERSFSVTSGVCAEPLNQHLHQLGVVVGVNLPPLSNTLGGD